MSEEKEVTRRVFLNHSISAGAALPFLALAVSCKSEAGSEAGSEATPAEPKEKMAEKPVEKSAGQPAATGQVECDISKLSEQELAPRKALKYVDKTPEPGKTCENCQLLVPAEQGGGCAGCTLFPGPVELEGYCTSWVQKT